MPHNFAVCGWEKWDIFSKTTNYKVVIFLAELSNINRIRGDFVNKLTSSICVLTSAVLWGVIALFYNQLTLSGFSALQIVFLRCATATVLTLVYVIIRNPKWLCIRLKDGWMFIGTGLVSLAFFNFCYFKAIDEASASTAAVLLYTAPIFVTLLSAVLFKERLTVVHTAAVFLTVVGCICVTELFSDAHITIKGFFYGLGAGVGYALYSIFGKIALRRYQSETITLYTFLFSSISILPLCGITQLTDIAEHVPAQTVWLSLGIGFFSTLLPYLLYTKGLEKIPAGQASVMATLEPVVATMVSVWILHDSISFTKIVGIVLVVGAVVLISLKSQKEQVGS